MTNPQTLDGGIDEDDRDQTEEQLAAAIAVLLAAKAASAPWLDLVQGSLAGLLRAYLQRSALAMAAGSGAPGAEAARTASDAVNGALGDVERHTASWLKQSADDRAPKAGTPMSADDAETAAGMIARTLATYARERVREEVARKLGATVKRWTSRSDDKVRVQHRELSGQRQPLDKPFHVDGMTIMRPGDPEAPLELTAGCRCWCIYTVGA